MKNQTILRWQAVTSTISATMVLVLLGILVLFVLTAREIRDSVRQDLTVTVVLSDAVRPSEAHALEQKLARRRYVHKATYISSEQALQEQVQSMGIDPSEFLGGNPFSISMELQMNADYANSDSLRWIARELRRQHGVADVIYQKDLVDSLNDNLHKITVILLVITILLTIVSLSLINNTIRLSVYSRRFIINTMKLVGARWNFIRRPFMLRGLLIAIIAAAVADAILCLILYWLQENIPGIRQYVTDRNVLLTAAVVLGFSIIITQLCTFANVTHYLRMREHELYK